MLISTYFLRRFTHSFFASFGLTLSLAAQPLWWSDYGFVDSALPAEDHQPATQGQAKWAIHTAKEYLDDQLTLVGGAGSAINTFVASLTNNDNQNVLTIGQAKYIGSLVVDRLVEVGYTGAPLNPNHPNQYPWTETTADDQDNAPCSIGQLKYLFSFVFTSPPIIDTDGDGIDDNWERSFFNNLSTFSRSGDYDNDGLDDRSEYLAKTNPTMTDTDGDTIIDGQDALPLDYYNAQLPVLTLVSGEGQTFSRDTQSYAPLVILITDSEGLPLANAPLYVTQVNGKLTFTTVEGAVSQVFRTQPDGHAQIFFTVE